MPIARVSVEIRPAAPADAEAVSTLIAQLGYQRSPAQVRAWIEDSSRAARDQEAFVACLDGQVVGWIEVSIEHRLQSPPFGFIGGLVVKDGRRGQGIGRLLCARAEEWTWQHGADTLRVTSRSTRLDAHRFYLRDGYREVKSSLVFEKTRQ